ncbi:S-layer homology domain-containing protein [Vallitalea pronyensis]|uniref:S-layer homology domain-containing protein n=1 Tax=Vallitalea pronyensis TaxID=1348613 RepID=A0A8J8SJ44_9FIRM|nr:S-layer homology domain-containing protein [Vallitalea pronyensis]QUI25107.1 S-layer homology domain-containing protein [Vallitalea pronyensis]
MKKLLSWCLVFMLLVAINIPSLAAGDEPSGWAKELVAEAIEKGYVPEHLQSDYHRSITREEFAELFVTAVFSEVNRQEIASAGAATKHAWDFKELTIDNFLSKVSTTQKFTDTDNKYVKVANILGMVNGVGDNTFNPDGLITREQACIMFVNYFQTVVHPGGGYALEELDDIHDASSWAKDAVIWSYRADFLKGTKEYIAESITGQKEPRILQMGHFDTKGTFTREQAIVVIAKLGNPNDNHLRNLVLRGYMRINMDVLMPGFEIDGNTIKMLKTGFESKYSHIKEYFRTQPILKDYVDKYTTEELIAAVWSPHGAQFKMTDTNHLDNVLSGNQTLYDYELFTIEHNKNGYLFILTKTPGYGYFEHCGGILFHRPNGWTGAPVPVTGKEVK